MERVYTLTLYGGAPPRRFRCERGITLTPNALTEAPFPERSYFGRREGLRQDTSEPPSWFEGGTGQPGSLLAPLVSHAAKRQHKPVQGKSRSVNVPF